MSCGGGIRFTSGAEVLRGGEKQGANLSIEDRQSQSVQKRSSYLEEKMKGELVLPSSRSVSEVVTGKGGTPEVLRPVWHEDFAQKGRTRKWRKECPSGRENSTDSLSRNKKKGPKDSVENLEKHKECRGGSD